MRRPHSYTIQHSIPADRRQLSSLRAVSETLVKTWLDTQILPPEAFDLLLALQEAVTNVIRHAYGDESTDGRVEVEFRFSPTRVAILIRDWGVAFDPDDVPEPDFENPQPGGYGVYIMKSVTDRFEYGKDGRANVLRLEKEFGPHVPAECAS